LIVLDASVVIAVLAKRDDHHAKASRFLEGHAHEQFVLHPVNLAETLVGAARHGRLGEVEQKIAALGVVPAAPDADEPGLVAELRIGTKLKLPDCYVLSLALQLSAPIATFDARLAAAAADRGISVVAIG
jgi:predicted nucleic acid-binding protein